MENDGLIYKTRIKTIVEVEPFNANDINFRVPISVLSEWLDSEELGRIVSEYSAEEQASTIKKVMEHFSSWPEVGVGVHIIEINKYLDDKDRKKLCTLLAHFDK